MLFRKALSSSLSLPVLVSLALAAAGAAPVQAQGQPWCAQDPLTSSPYPAPLFSKLEDLQEVPDYKDVSNNFRVAQSLRLLASTLEKGLAQLKSGGSLAGTPDIDGYCLCNCNFRDVSYWKDFLAATVTTDAQEALQKTEDRYLSDVQAKIDAGKMTLEDAVPGFRDDLAKIIQDTCEKLVTCDPKDPNQDPQALYKQEAEAARQELDTIFGPDISAAGLQDFRDRAQMLLKEVQDLLMQLSGPDRLTLLADPQFRQKIKDVFDEAQALYKDLKTKVQALATLLQNGDPVAWKNQVEQAMTNRLADIFNKDGKIWDAMKDQIRQKIDQRIQAIKTAALDLYMTATDGQAALDQFKQELTAGLLDDLKQVEGCYGITKRAACNVIDGFCKNTPEGHLFGDKVELPLWIPTEVFKDGKTALRFALETVDWLDKVRDYLENAQAPALVGGGKLLEFLKNGEELLQKLSHYVDLYTEGYHLGAYSDVRPDLHMCVGWAGHGVFADVVSSGNGDFRGGADYLSANLVEKQRAQFRAGGFALYINGHTVPLAPGISLNLQMDGFRLWDKEHPFGIQELGPIATINTKDVKKYDAFNLIDEDQLEQLCNPGDPKPCTLNATSFLYNGYFPVSYGSGMTWPRPGAAADQDARSAAVFGAGLNLDLDMKTRYWSASPIPVFPGATITPWLSLGAGVDWLYEVNHLRGTLIDKINQNLTTGKLKDDVFDRDQHPFQAADVTEDVGNGGHVNPKLGADLTLGIDLASWLKVGVTANLYVGVDVKAEGAGGVLDLSRPLVETLAQSNPPGDNCKPKIGENVTRTCSNEIYKKKDKCGNLPPEDRKDCVDLSQKDPEGTLYSMETYACREDDLACAGGKGYCTDASGKIVLHDVTRDDCEAEAATARCVAVYKDNPNGQGLAVSRPEDVVDLTSPSGIGYGKDAEVAKAQAAASQLTSPQTCTRLGWCYNWSYRPGEGRFDYIAVFLGTATSPEACPPALYRNGQIIRKQGTDIPLPAQFIRFEWQTSGPPPDTAKIGRSFHPYQCVKSARPAITGYEGPDCNPLEYGYPSACPDQPQSCACDPQKPQCPAGRVCVEGACLTSCAASASCGKDLTCKDGGCQMANGVPFAEQIAWRLKNDQTKPQHAIASYSLDKLITSVSLGLGVRVGMDYKIFRKWRSKNLLDLSKVIPLVAIPLVKHQLGLEAQYQDDCSAPGAVTNHQTDLVTRYPVASSNTADFLAWCKPQMAAQPENPAAQDPPEQMIGQGIEDSFQLATDVGLDFWSRGQLCVGNQTWDQYLTAIKLDPSHAGLWDKLRCAYGPGSSKQTLDCTGPGALQASLVTVLGCLDAAGPNALPQNQQLLAVLNQKGTAAAWLLPSSPAVFDLKKLLVADEGDLARSNLDPYILGLEKDGFPIDPWLTALNLCVSDASDGGRYVDENLDVSLGLGADDFKPCGGLCCVTGECHAVASQAECGGVFNPGTACFARNPPPGCQPVVLGAPAHGACVLFGKCQEVASAAQCQGAYFYAGAKCTDPELHGACAKDADCSAGTWCRDNQGGGKSCVPFAGEGQGCGGNVVPWARQICTPGLDCVFPEPTADVPGLCQRSCAAKPSGMVAWWPFEDPRGTKAAEVLAGHDGRRVNGPKTVTGAVGRALQFDGVDDYLEVADDQDLDFGTGDFSFVTWIKTSQQRGTQSILDKRRRNVGYHVFLYKGRLGLQLADGRYDNYVSQAAVADGQWHLVAVTVERGRTDGVRWYLDGAPVGPPGDPTAHRGSLTSASPLRFATRTLSSSGWWSGALDEPALFNRALTPAEVAAIGLAGPAGFCKCVADHHALEAWWGFNEQPDPILGTLGPEVYDSTAGHHDGQRIGGATLVPGVVGGAVQLDGVSGYVQVPPAKGLNLGTGDFSLDAWIRTSSQTGPRVIVSKRGSTAGYQLLLFDGRLALQLGDGAFTVFDSGVMVADGRWHHVAVTVERASASGVRFYVDGREAGQRGDATLRRGSLDNPSPLRFGIRTPFAIFSWEGTLDELTLHHRVLLPGEIAALFNARGVGRCYL